MEVPSTQTLFLVLNINHTPPLNSTLPELQESGTKNGEVWLCE